MIDLIVSLLLTAAFGLLLYGWDRHEKNRSKQWKRFDCDLDNSIRRANKAQWN